MIATGTDYLAIAERLPPGATANFSAVEWEEYAALLDTLPDNPRYRVSYDRGRLEIMTFSTEHEKYKKILARLIEVLDEEAGVGIESYGSTTFSREALSGGLEPDECYYIQHAAEVVGKRLDPQTGPPPDLAVEIDLSHPSLHKLPIYAALGVAELWRYRQGRVTFHRLAGDEYLETPRSVAFPFLTSEAFTGFVKLAETDGQSAAKRAFRKWVRTHHSQ
jgi:Uma2 family endonuclease